MADEIFESATRSKEDLAGVFEYTDGTGYFYLYEMNGDTSRKIVDFIHILSRPFDIFDRHVSVRWDATEDRVGLFIGGDLWAVFNIVQKTKHGGNYLPGVRAVIPNGETFLRKTVAH